MDAIDQVLEGLKLQSSVFSRLELGAGWGFSKDQLAGAPFHLVLEGEAWIGSTRDNQLLHLAKGDMVIVTRGQPHLLLSSPAATAVPWKQVLAQIRLEHWRPGQRIKPTVLRAGPAGAPDSRLISGVFEFAQRHRNPLLAALPAYLVLRCANATAAADRADVIGRLISAEIEENGPGAAMVASRLADYLFVLAVREHLVGATPANPGWLRGLRDPVVGAALQAIHAEPHRSWSVESLAAAVNMSRSQFAQRFKQHVGRGPIEYLTEWRMFEAARALTEGRSPLDEIARSSGYSSVAAFGKAFKQWSGESPGALRRSAQGKAPSR